MALIEMVNTISDKLFKRVSVLQWVPHHLSATDVLRTLMSVPVYKNTYIVRPKEIRPGGVNLFSETKKIV